MMILKEFSRIVCVSLFSYQGSLLYLCDSSFILSYSQLFVKNFFNFFKTFYLRSFETEKEGFEPSRRY